MDLGPISLEFEYPVVLITTGVVAAVMAVAYMVFPEDHSERKLAPLGQVPPIRRRSWRRHLVPLLMLLTIGLLGVQVAQPLGVVYGNEDRAVVVWVYDTSESMDEEDVVIDGVPSSRFNAVYHALEESLPSVPASFEKLLVGYSDSVTTTVPTSSNQVFLEQASSVPRGVTTAIDAGLGTAVSACSSLASELGEDTPCVLFLLSDGRCEPDIIACEVESEELARQAAELNVAVNTVAFGDDADAEFLELVATISGGSFLATADPSELAQQYQETLAVTAVTESYETQLWPAWAAAGTLALAVFGWFTRRRLRS